MRLWAHGLIYSQDELLEGDSLHSRLCACYMLVDIAKVLSKKGAHAHYHGINLAAHRIGFLNSPEKPLMLPHTNVPCGSHLSDPVGLSHQERHQAPESSPALRFL